MSMLVFLSGVAYFQDKKYMSIKLAIFDLAGTTVSDNMDVHRVLMNAMRKAGTEISLDEANEVMGIPKPVAIGMLLQRKTGEAVISKDRIDKIHHDFVNGMVEFYQTSPTVHEKEGVSQTFNELKRGGVKVFVDTGFDRQIVDVILQRMGWQERGLIDGSVCSDEVAFGRPFPDLVYRAMELASVDDSSMVAKIGDTVSDLVEGSNAGCRFVIGVTSGAHSAEKLREEYHTHLVERLEEVLPVLLS